MFLPFLCHTSRRPSHGEPHVAKPAQPAVKATGLVLRADHLLKTGEKAWVSFCLPESIYQMFIIWLSQFFLLALFMLLIYPQCPGAGGLCQDHNELRGESGGIPVLSEEVSKGVRLGDFFSFKKRFCELPYPFLKVNYTDISSEKSENQNSRHC